MAIPNPQPVHVPPQNEKTFNHLWLTSVRINAPSQTEGQIRIEYLPYDGVTQEIYHHGERSRVIVPNLWEAVAEVPEAAAAMQAFFDAVAPILAWQEAKQNGLPWPPVEESSESEEEESEIEEEESESDASSE